MRNVVHSLGKASAVAAIAVWVGAAVPAAADPVTVSGNINFFIFDSASVELAGKGGIELSTQLFGPGEASPPFACGSGTTGTPCVGRSLNLSVHENLGATPNAAGDFIDGGALLVNGGRLTLTAFDYALNAGNVIPPAVGTVSTPFTFSATATGMSSAGLTSTLDLIGSGLATARFDSTLGWVVTDFDFAAPSPSPTPEPASLLLLGTGLAAAWRRRRRELASR